MASVSSTMQELGTAAATFELPNVAGADQPVGLDDFAGKPLLVMFICNHCPYVVHVMASLAKLANLYQRLGCGVVAISANDIERYPQDAPERMLEFADHYGIEFPYCYDQTQAVAKAYGAACTPDFFVYDHHHRLRYRGQMDASRPRNGVPVSGQDLREALDAVLAGKPVSAQQTPSMGCSIKWKPQ